MRYRICRRVMLVGMLVAVSLSAALMVRAQAPAGPNRPSQVPEDFVVTPFGYFHPSCVVHLAEREELLEGGRVIQRADGTMYTVPVCEYPHYTARGEVAAAESTNNPPTITHSWIVAGNAITGDSYGEIAADWQVPSAPQSYDHQTIYLFPGLEDSFHDVSIIQPVLGWNSDFSKAWGIASWNCCPSGTVDESPAVRVNTGDHIAGTVKALCANGTITCSRWKITTEDQTTGGSTTLNNTPTQGQTFNWAFGGVLEVYSVVRCTDYPANRSIKFFPTVYDDNFNVIDNPNWMIVDLFSGLTPQCDYSGAALSDPESILLSFGKFTLTAATAGNGYVYSTDGGISCPSNCTHAYPAGWQITLNTIPNNGWAFAGWSGGGCSGTGPCTVTMTQDQTVTATFLLLHFLTVTTSGNGNVKSADGQIDCPASCIASYIENSSVTLNSYPAQGWSLNAWGGACSGNGSCVVTMTGDKSVSATFTQDSYTLTASISGQGTITSTDHFINCPGSCTHTYLSLTPVTLNASATPGWTFAGWSGACSGVGPCQVTMLGNYGVSAYFIQAGHGLHFTTVTPCRLVDTRTGNGGGGPIQAGTSQTFNLLQLAQAKGCADLSSAASYSLNVTLVPQNRRPVSYLTIWPAGLAQPLISTMNSLDGRIKANAAIVPAGVDSSVSIYATNTTDVVVDVDGYFAPSGQANLLFYPMAPCRVADTRKDTLPQGLGTPHLSAGVARDFPVLNAADCGIPAAAQAYSLNMTAIPYPTQGSGLGYLELWPTGQQPQSPVSTLNNPTGSIVANAAIVPAGADGQITAYASNDTDLAIDINGYFAAPGSGGLSLYPTAPCRVIDTRQTGNGQPFTGILSPPVDVVNSVCAPPASAHAYAFNATVVPSPNLSYLTLWPDSQNQPGVSTLNAPDGWITSNMAIVLSVDGKIDAYAAGITQLVLDISSYFAP